MKYNPYLRTGWSFLPKIVNEGGRISDLEYNQDIYESLQILFTTLPGERIAHPLYGCDLIQFMFRPIDNSLIANMSNTILTAITLYESRIEVVELVINANKILPHRLDINIAYILSKTSSRFNITIPFYTMEQQP